MTGENNAPVSIPQNTVVVNGAAINLITQLVEGVRRDMRAMEDRVNTKIDERFDAHEDMHDLQRTDDMGFQRRTRERLTDLEKSELARDKAKEFRGGQLSVLRTAGQLVDRYGVRVMTLVVALLTAAGVAFGGVKINLGP